MIIFINIIVIKIILSNQSAEAGAGAEACGAGARANSGEVGRKVQSVSSASLASPCLRSVQGRLPRPYRLTCNYYRARNNFNDPCFDRSLNYITFSGGFFIVVV